MRRGQATQAQRVEARQQLGPPALDVLPAHPASVQQVERRRLSVRAVRGALPALRLVFSTHGDDGTGRAGPRSRRRHGGLVHCSEAALSSKGPLPAVRVDAATGASRQLLDRALRGGRSLAHTAARPTATKARPPRSPVTAPQLRSSDAPPLRFHCPGQAPPPFAREASALCGLSFGSRRKRAWTSRRPNASRASSATPPSFMARVFRAPAMAPPIIPNRFLFGPFGPRPL